jgi:hypothetical protein
MGTYISSNANRFYGALETTFGSPAPVTAVNRFPAVRLQAQQVLRFGRRLDKTGTRTYLGSPRDARRQTAFDVRTYLTSWSGQRGPSYGPLVEAAMGAPPEFSQGMTVSLPQIGLQIQTAAPHNLTAGSAVSSGAEIRFVTAVADATTILLNAPFSAVIDAGTVLAPTVTYRLSTALPSLSLYDYWDPGSAVSRLVTGAGVDVFGITVNGDYHELLFSGPAADLLDSFSFTTGAAGLSSFPAEPALAAFDYSIVPGHLGQVWLGSPASQFFTLTQATIELKNHLDVRSHEFGSSYPRAIVPGAREIVSHITLYAQDDTATKSLYAAAKERNPVAAMLQLGQKQGQIMGVFLPSMTPEIPNFSDSETRLLWDFKNNLGQGASNDETYVAFA